MRISDWSSDVCSSDLRYLSRTHSPGCLLFCDSSITDGCQQIQDDGAFDRRAVGHDAFESPAMTFISVGSTGVGEADHAVNAAGTCLGGLLYALIRAEAGAKNSADRQIGRATCREKKCSCV